ncbi:MAG: iron ABC transporter permease [Candidatus Omnitrophota bacterium]
MSKTPDKRDGNRSRLITIWAIGLVLLGLGAVALALSLGSACIPVRETFLLILRRLAGIKDTGIDAAIIFNIRVPRIILAFLVGGALSISGVIMQGLFRNPLVEPYTLGISGGASFAVSIAVVLGLHMSQWLPCIGFAGALVSISVVYRIGRKVRGMGMTGLLLVGIMFTFICSALIMLVMSMAGSEQTHSILFWIMGNLEQGDRALLGVVAIVIPLASLAALSKAWDLNALSLGEEEAAHLGINVAGTRRFLFALGSLITGVAVSVSGVVGFVGLVVPHAVRAALGPDHRVLMPFSFFLGGIFLIVCDTVARTILSPMELPVGVITGLAGGLAFLVFLAKNAERI